jgi:hypothetical protein
MEVDDDSGSISICYFPLYLTNFVLCSDCISLCLSRIYGEQSIFPIIRAEKAVLGIDLLPLWHRAYIAHAPFSVDLPKRSPYLEQCTNSSLYIGIHRIGIRFMELNWVDDPFLAKDI